MAAFASFTKGEGATLAAIGFLTLAGALAPWRTTLRRTVVAGIPGEEATVKTYLRRRNKIVLRPENADLDEMIFDPADITIYGKVVTVLRRL